MEKSIPGKRCIECDGPIPWREGRGARETAKFCGNPCKFAYQGRTPARPRQARMTTPCATCGKPVTFLPSQRGEARGGSYDRLYCSRKCKGTGHSQLMTGRRPSNGVYTSAATFRVIARQAFHDRCSICGWAETPCDVAHIVPRKDGGTDTLDNVTMLCPNHHRKYDYGLITEADIRAARKNALKHQ